MRLPWRRDLPAPDPYGDYKEVAQEIAENEASNPDFYADPSAPAKPAPTVPFADWSAPLRSSPSNTPFEYGGAAYNARFNGGHMRSYGSNLALIERSMRPSPGQITNTVPPAMGWESASIRTDE